MNKVKELRIDSTLWATPARLVNLLDFEPEKISIETDADPFYLIIDDLKGYFKCSKDKNTTELSSL